MIKKYIAILSVFFISWSHAEVITVRADAWCPFNCAPQSKKPGYMIEIMQETLGKKGYTIDYQVMNWKRAITSTRAGRINAIVGASVSDVPDFIFPAVPLGNAASCFYVKTNSNWKYAGISSLNEIKVGLARDYSYDDEGEFDQYVKSHENNSNRLDMIAGEDPFVQNLSKLESGRIDALIEVEAVAQFNIQTIKKLTSFKKAGCFKSGDINIAFSPTHPKSKLYAQLLSDGVQELRKSGQLKKILSKYGLKDNF